MVLMEEDEENHLGANEEAAGASRRSGRRRAAKHLGDDWCEPSEVSETFYLLLGCPARLLRTLRTTSSIV